MGVQFGCYNNYIYPPNLMLGVKAKEQIVQFGKTFSKKKSSEAAVKSVAAGSKGKKKKKKSSMAAVKSAAAGTPSAAKDAKTSSGGGGVEASTGIEVYMKFDTSFPQFKGRVDTPKAGLEVSTSVKIPGKGSLALPFAFIVLPDPQVPTGFSFEIKPELSGKAAAAHLEQLGADVEGASQAFGERAAQSGDDPVLHSVVAGIAALDRSPHLDNVLDALAPKHEHLVGVAEHYHGHRAQLVSHALSQHAAERANRTLDSIMEIETVATLETAFCLTPYTKCMGMVDS